MRSKTQPAQRGAAISLAIVLTSATVSAAQPIHVAFLWHMHQPVYYPYESPIQTDAVSRFSFSVVDVHNQRLGPYTSWPMGTIQAGLSLSDLDWRNCSARRLRGDAQPSAAISRRDQGPREDDVSQGVTASDQIKTRAGRRP